MSSIKKTEQGRWRARWRTPDDSSRMKTFDRKVDAELWLTGIDHEKASGSYIDRKAGSITFREYAEQWRSIQQHRPSTAEQVETMLRNHAYPVLGRRPLNNVRHSELQTWVKGLEERLAPATIEVAARHVVSVFRSAVKDRILAVSPADGLKLPKPVRVEVVPLSVDQVLTIASAIQPRYAAMVMLMAGTGLRSAEAMGLTNDRVEWIPKSLRVDRQMVTVGGLANFGPPKTASSHRSIPLPTFVVEGLAVHLETYGLGDGGLIFSDASGRAIRRNRFGEVWRRAMKGLDFDCKGPHQLRHHYASLLIQHGESVKVVQSRLGHSSATETLDTYSHLWPDSEGSTRAAVEKVYGARMRGSRHVVPTVGGSQP